VAANSFIVKALSLLILISSACAGTESASNTNTVIEHAKRQVAVRTAELGEQITICNTQLESSSIPDITHGRLIDMGVTRLQIISALTYLSFRNFTLCEGRTREALAFALGTLSPLTDQYGLKLDSIDDIQSQLIYPSSRGIELEIEFLNLNDQVKNILLSAVGDRPFDLPETLRKNKLTNK
jgi:hypothetical protein